MSIRRKVISVAIALSATFLITFGCMKLEYHKWSENLRYAIVYDDVNKVKSLLSKESRIDYSMVEIACNCGNYEIVKLLVDNGADVSVKSDGIESLIAVIVNEFDEDDYDILKLVISCGADTTESNVTYPPLVTLAEYDIKWIADYMHCSQTNVEKTVCKEFHLIKKNTSKEELRSIRKQLSKAINKSDNILLKTELTEE